MNLELFSKSDSFLSDDSNSINNSFISDNQESSINSICQISLTINSQTINGAGFFCEIHDPEDDNKNLIVLFTCNHVLKINNNDDINNIGEIEFKFQDGEKKTLNLKNRRIWYDIENEENLNYTCIEIKKDEIEKNKIQLLTIEQNIRPISHYKERR